MAAASPGGRVVIDAVRTRVARVEVVGRDVGTQTRRSLAVANVAHDLREQVLHVLLI